MITTALGWIGQALFFSRFLVQWLASERAGRSVAPPSFWWLSLGGALLVGTYTLANREPVLAGGYLANAWMYGRSLRLASGAKRQRGPLRRSEIALVVTILALSWLAGGREVHVGTTEAPWLLVSVAGQLLWSGRFLVQWVASERAGRAHFPVPFWWLSLAGNSLLLAYALHRMDPLLICAFALGPVVQVRNLMLGREPAEEGLPQPEPLAQRSPGVS